MNKADAAELTELVIVLKQALADSPTKEDDPKYCDRVCVLAVDSLEKLIASKVEEKEKCIVIEYDSSEGMAPHMESTCIVVCKTWAEVMPQLHMLIGQGKVCKLTPFEDLKLAYAGFEIDVPKGSVFHRVGYRKAVQSTPLQK